MYLTILQTNNITKLKGKRKRTDPCDFEHSILTIHPQTKLKKNFKQTLSSSQ